MSLTWENLENQMRDTLGKTEKPPSAQGILQQRVYAPSSSIGSPVLPILHRIGLPTTSISTNPIIVPTPTFKYVAANGEVVKIQVPHELAKTETSEEERKKASTPKEEEGKLLASKIEKIKALLSPKFKELVYTGIVNICPENIKTALQAKYTNFEFIVVSQNGMNLGEKQISYNEIPARVVSFGTNNTQILINAEHPDYYDKSGELIENKVLSTAIHESLHFFSAQGTGFVKSTHKLGNTDPAPLYDQLDEAMTDYLAYKVFNAIYPEKCYHTGYWAHFCNGVNTYAGAWTGDIIPIIVSFENLGITITDLKNFYFDNPKGLSRKLESITDVAALKQKWAMRKAEVVYQKYHVVISGYASQLMDNIYDEWKSKNPEQSSSDEFIKYVKVNYSNKFKEFMIKQTYVKKNHKTQQLPKLYEQVDMSRR